MPAPDAPARAGERLVGDGGEALLVGAQREQQVADAVGARQVRVVDADAEAVDGACAADEQRARLADEPRPEPAGLEHEAGARVQVARVVVDEVAEQAERGALRVLALRAASAGPPSRPRFA